MPSARTSGPIRTRAGHGEPHQVGLRGAGDEQAAGRGGVAGGLGAPAHDLLLDEHRRVVGAAHVGVEHAGEEVGEVADRVAGAHVPAPEPRVVVAHRVGHDGAPEVVVGGLEPLGRAGERAVEGRSARHPAWAATPVRRAARRCGRASRRASVREGAEGRPVGGVQAGVAVVGRVRRSGSASIAMTAMLPPAVISATSAAAVEPGRRATEAPGCRPRAARQATRAPSLSRALTATARRGIARGRTTQMNTRGKVALAGAVTALLVVGGAGTAYATHFQDRALPGAPWVASRSPG